MKKIQFLVFIPLIIIILIFTAQVAMAQTIKNDPPALEEKNSMPNATYSNKYLGPQVEVTRDSVRLTQGYDKKSKNNSKKNSSSTVKKDKGRIEPIESGDIDAK